MELTMRIETNIRRGTKITQNIDRTLGKNVGWPSSYSRFLLMQEPGFRNIRSFHQNELRYSRNLMPV